MLQKLTLLTKFTSNYHYKPDNHVNDQMVFLRFLNFIVLNKKNLFNIVRKRISS